MSISLLPFSFLIGIFAIAIFLIIQSNKNSDEDVDKLVLLKRTHGVEPTLLDKNNIKKFISNANHANVTGNLREDLNILASDTKIKVPEECWSSNTFATATVNANIAELNKAKEARESQRKVNDAVKADNIANKKKQIIKQRKWIKPLTIVR